MNTKLSIIDSIYDIEDSMCESSLDTISSMIEASDKAYSIIKECSSYGDEVYDMFAIFQEADDNMDPDQHGKKIADMNDKEKAAYREKHAFKEDSAFMTFLNFIPNLFGLIVRSIKKLFTKKPDQNAVQKAINTIQNWSEEHKEAASEIINGLYEKVLGGKPNGATWPILGIGVPVGLLTGIAGTLLVGGTAALTACKERIQGFFNTIFKRSGNVKKIKYGLKLEWNEDKSAVHWKSDVNIEALGKFVKDLTDASTSLGAIYIELGKSSPDKTTIVNALNAFNKKFKEIQSDEYKKKLVNDESATIKNSSKEISDTLTGIVNSLTNEDTGLVGAITSNMKNISNVDKEKIKQVMGNESINLPDIQEFCAFAVSVSNMCGAMSDHINAMMKTLGEGNFVDKFIAKLREKSKDDGFVTKIIDKLGGKTMALKTEKEEFKSNENSEEEAAAATDSTLEYDGKKYKKVGDFDPKNPPDDDQDMCWKDDTTNKVNDVQQYSVLTKGMGNTLEDISNEGWFPVEEITSASENDKQEVPENVDDTGVGDEAQQKPKGETGTESFVDNTDDDVINEQVSSRWYSL